MKKQLTNKTVYQPNADVKVTVITVKIKRLVGEEVKFGTDDEIADFIGNVDYSEPQMSLLGRGNG